MRGVKPEVSKMREVPALAADTDADIDAALASAEFVRDPYPLLDLLREREGAYWSESLGAWVLTRYHDIVATFRDAGTYANEGRLARAAAYLLKSMF